MESQLLNAYHDDHFDGNYSKYDTSSSLWSDGTDTLGLQFTETLHGILPISPTDEKTNFFDNEIECESKISYRLQHESDIKQDIYELQNNRDNYATHYSTTEIYQNMSPSIEIISVDPNCEFSSPISIDNSESENEYDDNESNNVDEDSCDSSSSSRSQSQVSYYNNDVDSSSIGDYVSHSSDDDDENYENTLQCYNNTLMAIGKLPPNINNAQLLDQTSNNYEIETTINSNQFIPKKNTLNTVPFESEIENIHNISFNLEDIELNELKLNTSCEDKKLFDTNFSNPLESEIDVKNFDLATFITQDDFNDMESTSVVNESNNILCNPTKCDFINQSNVDEFISRNHDSDTDAIIDIETVHDNENTILPNNMNIESIPDLNENLAHIENDDPIRDPSWSPSGKTSKSQKPATRSRTRQTIVNKISVSNEKLKNKKLYSIPQNSRLSEKNSKSTIIIEKSQYGVLDRKTFGLGRGKNISMCLKPEISDNLDNNDIDNCDEHLDNIVNNKTADNSKNSAIEINTRINQKNMNTNISSQSFNNDGNNSASVIKPENSQNIENIKVNKICKDNINKKIFIKHDKNEITSNDFNTAQSNVKLEPPLKAHTEEIIEIAMPVKKKLNLEEYKKRRENQKNCGTTENKIRNKDIFPLSYSGKSAQIPKFNEPKKSNAIPQTPNNKQNMETSLLNAKQFQNQTKSNKKIYDPILEAKNKVLRMQELKKVARTKLIDSTVSAKVGPVTKILPLEEITLMSSGNCAKTQNENFLLKTNPDYEEIIIVSASCNTDVTLPPIFEKLSENSFSSIAESSTTTNILKSSSLLLNINNTLQKAKSCRDNIKISSNSLISSIQDVVLKKSNDALLIAGGSSGGNTTQKSPNIGVSPPSQYSPEKPEMSHTEFHNVTNNTSSEQNAPKINESEHGEDKVIMHLRKDRIRARTFTTTTQTDMLPEFPPLELLKRVITNATRIEQKDAKRDRHRRKYRSRCSASYSSDDGDYKSHSRSRFRTISPRNCRLSSERNRNRCYSNSKRTVSPHHRRQQQRCRSRSRTKSRAFSSSESEKDREDGSRERRKKRYNSSHSRSSSCNGRSSLSRSRSQSRSSRSRTRSRSKSHYGNINNNNSRSRPEIRRHDRPLSPAVEERRIVYVGRIEREISKEDLKRKFVAYGPIRQITLHYKDTGMKYGFVTFERAQDAYRTIDSGVRDPKINMYDISFGGRRAFCGATYSDLDGAATNSLQVLPFSSSNTRTIPDDDSFEALLKKVKDKISSSKSIPISIRNKT